MISCADFSKEDVTNLLGARMTTNNIAKLFENHLRAFLSLFDTTTFCSASVLS